MNSTRQGRKRAGVIAAAGLTALVGTGLLASPASAHTPVWHVTCDTFKFQLSNYNANVQNTVSVTSDGKVLLAPTTFGSTYPGGSDWATLNLPDHSSPVQVELVVKAGDDPKGKHGWSIDQTVTAPACQTTSPPPSSSPTPPPAGTPTPSASATGSPTPSQTAPVAAPSPSTSSPRLAETGSSSSTPVIAGIGAAVVLAGGALLVVNRKRRAGSH